MLLLFVFTFLSGCLTEFRTKWNPQPAWDSRLQTLDDTTFSWCLHTTSAMKHFLATTGPKRILRSHHKAQALRSVTGESTHIHHLTLTNLQPPSPTPTSFSLPTQINIHVSSFSKLLISFNHLSSHWHQFFNGPYILNLSHNNFMYTCHSHS